MANQRIEILLVEDDPAEARVLERKLRLGCGAEFVVTLAQSLEEAQQQLRTGGPDVVLLDLTLPGHDGVEAIRALREISAPPVIALGDADDDGRGSAALRAGAQDFLPKADVSGPWLKRSIHHAIEREHLLCRTQGSFEELRASERLLRASLDALAARVAVLDPDGVIVCSNAIWRDSELAEPLLGEAAVDGCSYLELCERAAGRSAPTAGRLAEGIRGVLAGRARDFALDFSAPSRERERWFSTTVTALPGAEPRRAAVSHVEITHHKRAESELSEDRDQALAASRSKSEFLARMSHEIRTPMNAIIGMTDIVLDESDLAPPQRQCLELVQSSASSLLFLLNDILDFSKIEARRLELEKIPFSLRGAVSGAMKSLAVPAHEKGLDYECSVPSEIPDRIVGDPGRLRQILMNLLANAIKFTHEGQILVRVTQMPLEGADLALHFEVADTGIGIPPEKQPLIFESFAQADHSTSREFGGSGLGLAISAQLVELFGGRIWVESSPGRGSTFHFTARFEQPTEQTDGAPPSAPVELEGLPVLVVDDSRTSCAILTEVLESSGMRPLCVEDVPAALEAIEAAHARGEPFRLAILDETMPANNGFEVARRLREDPRNADLELILMTPAGYRGDAARCREVAIGGYLTKPVSSIELLEAIRMMLASSDTEPDTRSLITRHSVRERRQRLKILLAEDNVANQKLAVHLLTKWGHRVTAVDDGLKALEALEALEAVEAGGFDLVLMDVQMPNMDGLEATARIREREASAGGHIPIVALTAHSMGGDRERCIQAGMDGYVSKPIQAAELYRSIEALMRSSEDGSVDD
jgi:CheY-like chemotaxis protein/nitrogen-specific signal transduction histidine kinase